jgi:hypothetical protein
LAFAIVLAPSLMQTETDCTTAGDTRLEVFRVVVAGEDMITLDPEQRVYEVMLPEQQETIWVRACAMDKAAEVYYRLSDVCEPKPPLTKLIASGQGVFVIEAPEGHSTLEVWVRAPDMAMEAYRVLLTQPKLCQ